MSFIRANKTQAEVAQQIKFIVITMTLVAGQEKSKPSGTDESTSSKVGKVFFDRHCEMDRRIKNE